MFTQVIASDLVIKMSNKEELIEMILDILKRAYVVAKYEMSKDTTFQDFVNTIDEGMNHSNQ